MKYFIITYGCQMNQSDSERIAAVLEKIGYSSASEIAHTDLIVVNMCSIRQSAVDRVYGLLPKFKKLKEKNKKLKTILTGCILKSDLKKFRKRFDYILSIKDLPNWKEIFRSQTSYGKSDFPDFSYLKIKPKYSSDFSAYIPISNGCNKFCSYCAVPYTRGPEIYRPVKEILKEVKNVVKKGFKEIWLLGQNVNSYQSQEVNFPKLLKMVQDIPGDFYIKFMSPNPKDFSDELIDVMAKSNKVAKELNLPVQSGDNKILKKMKRSYTIEQYKNLVKKIRAKMPGINLSTDVIVGFPEETKKQFENTVKLFKQIKFNMAYISKYSPRPGTAAFQMKDNVSPKEKRRRQKTLTEILNPVKNQKGKLVVILGQTACGKSKIAVKLAKQFNGEIVSADSRQVYKEMNIGTAKITKKEMEGIPHHLIDIIKPNKEFNAAIFKQKAIKIIKDIQKRKKIPFLTGGTGLYIQTIVDNIDFPKAAPNKKLRKKLEQKSAKELFCLYKKLDPKGIKEIEKYNKRRLIRAIEVCQITGKPFSEQKSKGKPLFNVLEIGIKKSKEEIKKSVEKRIKKMFKMGLENEVKGLVKKYGQVPCLQTIGYQESSQEEIILHTLQFARRQMTWFKKDKKILWVKNYQQAKKLTRQFLF